jgi:hypothetical protein
VGISLTIPPEEPMSRSRIGGALGALAALLLIVACQTTGASPSLPSVALPSGLPTSLPSGLESMLPSNLPSLPAIRQSIAQFEEVNGSGITGGALFLDAEGETVATVGVVAPGETAPLMARVIEGTCADAADDTVPVATLPDLAAGASNGSIPMALDDVAGSHAIVIVRGAPPPSEDPNASAPAASAPAESPPAESEAPTDSNDPTPLGELGELVACADIPAPAGG